MIKIRKDPRENAQKLFEIASEQGGYFTAKQALLAGYYYRLQNYHRSQGNWMEIDRGVFRLRNFPNSEREDLIRWSLWSCNRKGEPQAVVSHQTACAFYDLGDLMPAKIHLTISPKFYKKIPGGCVVHRGLLKPEEVKQFQGFKITTPLRTLYDLADGSIESDQLYKAVKDALSRGMVEKDEISKLESFKNLLKDYPDLLNNG